MLVPGCLAASCYSMVHDTYVEFWCWHAQNVSKFTCSFSVIFVTKNVPLWAVAQCVCDQICRVLEFILSDNSTLSITDVENLIYIFFATGKSRWQDCSTGLVASLLVHADQSCSPQHQCTQRFKASCCTCTKRQADLAEFHASRHCNCKPQCAVTAAT